jgi:hypothetical protein
MELKTQILIHARPEKVWSVLMDFEKYEQWNPFIKSIRGDAQVGQFIAVTISPPDGKAMKFEPEVRSVIPEQQFSWKGKLWFKGIFDGEHQFKLKDNGDGTTTFFHSEKFSGILVGLLKKQLETNTKKGFEMMNQQLKKNVEANNL